MTENPKKPGERGGGEYYLQGLQNETEAGSRFPMGRKVCLQATVAGKDLWDGSVLAGKPFEQLDHDSTTNHMLWAVAFCPKFIMVAQWAYHTAVFASMPIVWLPCTCTHPFTVCSCEWILMNLNINSGHFKKTAEVWSLNSSNYKVWYFFHAPLYPKPESEMSVA